MGTWIYRKTSRESGTINMWVNIKSIFLTPTAAFEKFTVYREKKSAHENVLWGSDICENKWARSEKAEMRGARPTAMRIV